MTHIPALNFATGGYCPELDSSYLPGQYQAKDAEEYKALAPYAVDAPELELDDADKDREALIEEAKAMNIAAPSTLARWGVEKLKTAIAEAKG